MALTLRGLLGSNIDILGKERQDHYRACADLGSDRTERYRLYESLYDNLIKPPLDGRQREYLDIIAGIPFSEGFLAPIVDTMARRLEVTAIRVEGNKPAEEWLNKMWSRDRVDASQGVVHTETLKKGDGFVAVSWDNKAQRPCVRWNRPERCRPEYDEETGELTRFIKVWSTRKVSVSNPSGALIVRLNIYLPDRIEKLWAQSNDEDTTWQAFTETDGDPWPTPWTESLTLPADGVAEDALGIPFTHFANRRGDRWFGRSELRAGVPFKLELDKWLLDLFDVMDAQGAKQRWGSGVTSEGALTVKRGEWVTSAVPEARFGEFSAEDPAGLLAAIRDTLMRMSAATATPFHDLIRGDPPSGEALKVAESGQTQKCDDFIVHAGDAWEDTAAMMWRLGSVFGTGVPAFDADAVISVEWDSTASRDDVQEALKYESLQRLGLSKATALRELGYDPKAEADLRAEEAKVTAAAMVQAFNSGATNPPPPADPQPVNE